MLKPTETPYKEPMRLLGEQMDRRLDVLHKFGLTDAQAAKQVMTEFADVRNQLIAAAVEWLSLQTPTWRKLMATSNPIILALDTPDIDQARRWALACRPHVGMLKIGLEFYLQYGQDGYHALAKYGLPIMLDLKLHDIPNTVAGALRRLMPLSPAFVTVHAFGGPAMIQAARDSIAEHGQLRKTKLIAVTVLTSLTNETLRYIGVDNGAVRQVSLLAGMAIEAGADGVVCSAHEAGFVRKAHPCTTIICPGIRPSGTDPQDQARPSTPQQAMMLGASHLVIGRPITDAPNLREAAQAIRESLL